MARRGAASRPEAAPRTIASRDEAATCVPGRAPRSTARYATRFAGAGFRRVGRTGGLHRARSPAFGQGRPRFFPARRPTSLHLPSRRYSTPSCGWKPPAPTGRRYLRLAEACVGDFERDSGGVRIGDFFKAPVSSRRTSWPPRGKHGQAGGRLRPAVLHGHGTRTTCFTLTPTTCGRCGQTAGPSRHYVRRDHSGRARSPRQPPVRRRLFPRRGGGRLASAPARRFSLTPGERR